MMAAPSLLSRRSRAGCGAALRLAGLASRLVQLGLQDMEARDVRWFWATAAAVAAAALLGLVDLMIGEWIVFQGYAAVAEAGLWVASTSVLPTIALAWAATAALWSKDA
jgi:hypothetical protein